MMDPWGLLLWSTIVVTAAMVGLWFVERWAQDISIADVAWCALLVATVTWYAVAGTGEPWRRALVAMMAGIYGVRLGLQVLLTRVLGQPEDPRYQALRRRWGPKCSGYLLGYFVLQAGAVMLFSLPFLVVMQSPRPAWSLWDCAGLLIWAVAVVGETVADRQLAAFKRRHVHDDAVCRQGLWYYSRHPNYFFEWLHWWAYVAMAVGVPHAWLTWLGPGMMGWALIGITGIPWAEAQALHRRGEAYRQYQRVTSAFIPWFPRKGP